jgi:hypothetical protein
VPPAVASEEIVAQSAMLSKTVDQVEGTPAGEKSE